MTKSRHLNHCSLSLLLLLIYRVLYHLKDSVNSTNRFVKIVFRIQSTVSPTILWYQGDDNLLVSMSQRNAKSRNNLFVPSKLSDRAQLEAIIAQSQNKPQPIYKKPKSCYDYNILLL